MFVLMTALYFGATILNWTLVPLVVLIGMRNREFQQNGLLTYLLDQDLYGCLELQIWPKLSKPMVCTATPKMHACMILAYSSTGEFISEYRSISFAFNTDGVNPYSQNRVSYSMWPIILTVLNLPRKIRYCFGNFWLVGTVPGNGTKEPHHLDPYLCILVDELLSITNKQVYDAYQCAPFRIKVDILLFIMDYPGIGKVFNVMGANAYQACAWCEIQGNNMHECELYVVHFYFQQIFIIGTYSSELHKIVYLHNRTFLPDSSALIKA